MAAEPQDFEPEKLTAGVKWKWKKLILTIQQAMDSDLLITELVYELKR